MVLPGAVSCRSLALRHSVPGERLGAALPAGASVRSMEKVSAACEPGCCGKQDWDFAWAACGVWGGARDGRRGGNVRLMYGFGRNS